MLHPNFMLTGCLVFLCLCFSYRWFVIQTPIGWAGAMTCPLQLSQQQWVVTGPAWYQPTLWSPDLLALHILKTFQMGYPKREQQQTGTKSEEVSVFTEKTRLIKQCIRTTRKSNITIGQCLLTIWGRSRECNHQSQPISGLVGWVGLASKPVGSIIMHQQEWQSNDPPAGRLSGGPKAQFLSGTQPLPSLQQPAASTPDLTVAPALRTHLARSGVPQCQTSVWHYKLKDLSVRLNVQSWTHLLNFLHHYWPYMLSLTCPFLFCIVTLYVSCSCSQKSKVTYH